MDSYRIIVQEQFSTNEETQRKEKFTAIIKQLIKFEMENIENADC